MRLYFDTSAMAKRYFDEPYSDKVDEYYELAWRSKHSFTISILNFGEFVDILTRKIRKSELSEAAGRELLQDMQGEMLGLRRVDALHVVPLTDDLLGLSWALALKERVYVSDAVQIITSEQRNCELFLTADKELANVASKKKLKTELLGSL